MHRVESQQTQVEGIKGSVSFPHLLPCLHIAACTGFALAHEGLFDHGYHGIAWPQQESTTYSLRGGMGFADGGVCILSLIWWPLREGPSKHWQTHGRAGSEMSRARVSWCSSSIQFEGLPCALAILPRTATHYADHELGEKSFKQTFLFLRNLAITKIHLKCGASGDVLDVASFICWTPAIKSVIVATHTVSVAGSQCQLRCIVCNEQQGLWLDLG